MAQEIAQPYNGPLLVDLTSLAGILIDLIPGGMQRLRREQEGFDDVEEELAKSVPALGAAAGIPQDVYAHFTACTENLKKIRAARRVVMKLAEILEESEAMFEHDRETDISLMVDAIKSTARRKSATMLAAFEKTLRYNSQAADKALRTRRKNAEAKAGETPPAEPPPGGPAPQPA